jgi:hypothetical protein
MVIQDLVFVSNSAVSAAHILIAELYQKIISNQCGCIEIFGSTTLIILKPFFVTHSHLSLSHLVVVRVVERSRIVLSHSSQAKSAKTWPLHVE